MTPITALVSKNGSSRCSALRASDVNDILSESTCDGLKTSGDSRLSWSALRTHLSVTVSKSAAEGYYPFQHIDIVCVYSGIDVILGFEITLG
jgi:hypothetical protein